MKYSIIIPAFNEEKNLESWFGRFKCKRDDYEILIIDDGSVDKTLLVAEKIGEKNRHVRVMHQKNQGVSVARNAGIYQARGEWIIFADADDVLRVNSLDIFDPYLDKDTEIIQANQIMYGQNDNQNEKIFIEIPSFKIQKVLLNREKYKKEVANNQQQFFESVHGVCGKAFRRDFLIENEIRFQEGLGLGEDILFYFDALACTEKVILINETVYEVVENKYSSTRTFNPKMQGYTIEFSRQITQRVVNSNKREMLWGDMCYQIYLHLDCGVINNLGYNFKMPIKRKKQILNNTMQCTEIKDAIRYLYIHRKCKGLINRKKEEFIIWLIQNQMMGIYFALQNIKRRQDYLFNGLIRAEKNE